MKNLIIILCLFIGTGIFAQAPQSFSYQTVVHDLSGNILANQSLSFRISLLSGSETGTEVYREIHAGKTTNDFGLADLEIGKGTPAAGDFSSISWGTNKYYIKVEIDPAGGTAYQSMGTSQLLSVPYALYTKDVQNNNDADADATNELQKITLSGTLLTLDKGGGTVTLPSSGGGDNWGTQVVKTNSSLSGQGNGAASLAQGQHCTA